MNFKLSSSLIFIVGPIGAPSGLEGVAFVNSDFNTDRDWPDIELVHSSLNIAQDAGFVYNNNIFRIKNEVSQGGFGYNTNVAITRVFRLARNETNIFLLK